MIAAVKQDVAQREAGDTASELKTLADLHDRGKLTDAEFAAEKARLLGPVASGESPQTPGPPSPAWRPPPGGSSQFGLAWAGVRCLASPSHARSP